MELRIIYRTCIGILGLYALGLHFVHILEITQAATIVPQTWLIIYTVLAGSTVTLGVSMILLYLYRHHKHKPEKWDTYWIVYGYFLAAHTCLMTLWLGVYYGRYQGYGPSQQNPFDEFPSLVRRVDWSLLHWYGLGFGLLLDFVLMGGWVLEISHHVNNK